MNGSDPAPPPADTTAGSLPDEASPKGKKRATKGPKKKATKQRSAADGEAPAKATAKKKSKTAGKRAVKKTKSRRRKPRSGALPPKALVLTDGAGQLAGVLPKDALVMIKPGIVRDALGKPVGVDPRPTQKAFLWLLGYRLGQGLDPAAPHQRQALRIVEHLVRASVMGDTASQELIVRLYSEAFGGAPQDDPNGQVDAPPLSSSELSLPRESEEPPDES